MLQPDELKEFSHLSRIRLLALLVVAAAGAVTVVLALVSGKERGNDGFEFGRQMALGADELETRSAFILNHLFDLIFDTLRLFLLIGFLNLFLQFVGLFLLPRIRLLNLQKLLFMRS